MPKGTEDTAREDQGAEDQGAEGNPPEDTGESSTGAEDGSQSSTDAGTEDTGAEGAGDPDDAPEDRDAANLRKARKEAARYRSEARDAQAARDTAATALDAAHRAHAESLTGGRFYQAGDLWTDGATTADVLDESGNVDPGKVKEITDRVIKSRPGLSPNTRQTGAAGKGPKQGNSSITTWQGATKATRDRDNWATSIYDAE